MGYLIIKIPFLSKGYLYSKSKYKISGNAYYFCCDDNGDVFHQYALININSHYRKNNYFENSWMTKIDNNGNVGTVNYRRFKNIRENYGLFKKLQLMDDNELGVFDKQEDVNQLNNIIINNFNKVLTTESLLTGSNTSGAEQNIKNTPFLFYDKGNKNNKYNMWRFTNYFNLIEKRNRKKEVIKNNKDWKNIYHEINQHKIISLGQWINKFKNVRPDINNVFNKIYNYEYFEGDFVISKMFENYFNDELRKDSIDILRFKYDKEKSIDENKFKSYLRSIYIKNINIQKKYYSFNCHLKNIKVTDFIIEKSHIKSFETCFLQKEYMQATDPFNLILVDANTHTLFDKNIITIDFDGNIKINKQINKKEQEVINNNLLSQHIIDKWIKIKRVNKYIVENYNHFKITNKNL